jgi:hypothetical protein
MKTMKLSIGICGALMAMAAFAAPAPAQVSGGTSGGGGGGVITRVLRPIIYDHEAAAPSPIRRHLKIGADGAATLVEVSGPNRRVVKGVVAPADMADLEALAAQLDQPGDVTAGAAADDDGGTTLTVGLLKVRLHVTMARPAGRMLARRLDRIAAKLAAE